MKTAVKSTCLLFVAGVVSAHNHRGNKGYQAPLPITTEAPKPTTATEVTTVTTLGNNTAPVDPVSPVLKAIMDKAVEEQVDEVTSAFYQLFHSGHLDVVDYIPAQKSTEGGNNNYSYNQKYEDDCPGCSQDKRYHDFDYPYEINGSSSKTCYAIRRSDEGYNGCDFEDISSTGTALTFTDGATTINLDTSFPYFDRQKTTPTVQVFINGFISFTVVDPASLTGGNSLPNPSEAPFDILAPYYQSQTLGAGSIINPAVYYTTSTDETIIQWETNENKDSTYTKSTEGSSIYQLKIKSSGEIYFVYKLSTCEIPSFSTVQVGVKPQQTELVEGYRTSFFQTACQNGQYYAPCAGQSIKLERVCCNSLIGQTGIQKPKVQKKYYKKEYYKKEYSHQSKPYYNGQQKFNKQQYVDHFNQIGDKIFGFFH